MRHALLLIVSIPSMWAAVNFDREVRPIFSDNCFACHGPDEKHRMAKLRLDTPDGGLARVVAGGHSAESKLFQRINAPNKALRMPPPASGHSLTDKQIDTVRRWIDEGAKWELHWAYVAPKRPAVPETKDPKWPRNAIDNFILSRLEREGLRPSPEADKVTLLRRVTFDLTGLPPTPAEIDALLADKSPNAYEKRVDALLASPRWGERMAMQWLDLARYADTHGYHIDSHRDMWPWRDWVVRAFNRNISYREFVIDQLAGDLLPGATTDQKIATGFNRNHMINFEGGAIPEEYQNEYVVDRVEATSTAFMGTTMGCARCHDHKYDPISQRDFYRFYAFFNTIPEKGLDGRAGNAEPFLPLPNPQQKDRLDTLTRAIEAHEKALPGEQVAHALSEWEKTASLAPATREGLIAHYEMDGNLSDSSGHYRHGRRLKGDPAYVPGEVGRAADFGEQMEAELPAVDAPRYTLAFWVRTTGIREMTVLAGRGWEIGFDESAAIGDLKRGAHLRLRMNGSEFLTKEPLVTRDWYHVCRG